MDLLNFVPLIQLSIGINLAFIAVEYAKSYTFILSHKIFNFPDMINREFLRYDEIFDKAKKLEDIPADFKLGENSAFEYVEELKVRCGKFEEETSKLKIDLNNEADKLCIGFAFSSICLWLFLFHLILLFCIGIIKQDSYYTYSFIVVLSAFTYIFVIIGWFIKKTYKFFNLSSKKVTILLFVVGFVLTIPISTYVYHCIDYDLIKNIYERIIIPIVVSPYLNFIVYFIIIGCKANSIKCTLRTKVDDIHEQADSLEKEIAVLLSSLQAHRNIIKSKERVSQKK